MKRVMIEGGSNLMAIDQSTLRSINQVSHRVTRIYEDITRLVIQDSMRHFSPQQYKTKLQQILQKITYKNQKVRGPICRQNSKKSLFYHCFDCEKDVLTSICQACFSEGQHIGHNFRTYNCECYCDCGNQQILNNQFFCPKHKNFKEPTKIDSKQAQIYCKELQFLLLLSFMHFQNIGRVLQTKRQSLILLVLSLFKNYIKVNYNYQKLTSKVLFNKFDKIYRYRDNTIIEQLMIKINWSQKTIKQISRFLVELQPVEKARVQLIAHYWNILNDGLKTLKIINKMETFQEQYMGQSSIILRLLRKGVISPWHIESNINNSKQQIGKYYIFYKLYQKMSHSNFFAQIINEILAKTSISSFYNYHNCAKQSQNSQVLQINYINLLLQILSKINVLQNKRQILVKMLKESYSYLKQCDKDLRRCPKITFTLCLFSLFNFDLDQLKSSSIEQFRNILQVNEGQQICQLLNKIIWQQNILINNLLKDRQLQSSPQIFLSCEYLFYKVVFAINQMINKQSDFMQNYFNSLNVQRKEAQIAQEGQSICQTILNIIYSNQTILPETIIENYLHKGNKHKILQFYGSLYTVNKQMSRINFKKYAESWIANQECLKEFITKQSLNSNKQQRSNCKFNISFLSQFCKFYKVTKEEINQRLIMNVNNDKNQINQIFGCSLKKIEDLLSLLVQKQKHPIGQNNYLVELLMVLFLATKSYKYLQLIDIIFNKIRQDDISKDYLQYRIKIKEIINQKNQQANKKKPNKSKKLQKLQQMRLLQQKCLKQHQQQIAQAQKDTAAQSNSCIICRQNKNEKLSYLCLASFSSNMMKNVLKIEESFVLISTCGHVIHQKCLSSSIDPNNSFQSKFSCFLCRKISNIRIPIYQFYTQSTQKELRDHKSEYKKFHYYYKFVQEFLTVLNIQISQKTNRQQMQQELKLQRFAQIASKSIIYSIYFYFLSFPKVFITYMMPFLGSICSLVKFSIENKLSNSLYESKIEKIDVQLQQVQKIFIDIINKAEGEQINLKQMCNKQQNYNYKTQLLKLKLYILNPSSTAPFNLQKRLFRLNLYNFPKDLVQLNKQIGNCQNCNHIHSKLKICLYCGIKICIKCKTFLQKHINTHHGGAAIMIDTQFGQYYYYFNKSNLRCQSLYCNYIGESYPYEHKKPKEGYFLLDEKLEQTLMINALLQNTEDIVENENLNDRCLVQ